jgi:hypothetical protein
MVLIPLWIIKPTTVFKVTYFNFYKKLNSSGYRGGKEEATRRIIHTLRKPTTLPTKVAV